MPEPVPISHLVQQLLELGVEPGGVLLVHCAFSKVEPVAGGPLGLITALQGAVGSNGTLVMPSMADTDDEPFDRQGTPCRHMGVVAEMFWRLPKVLRSDSPHAFAAWGKHAAHMTAPHPVDVPHGLDSPVGRVYERCGQVLLLGVGHHANTTIHLAENLAGVRYRLPASAVILQEGRPVRVAFQEVDHCCQNFAQLDRWLKREARQRHGVVGHTSARLARAQHIVEVAVRELRRQETVFLHPPGVCEECDQARSGLGLLGQRHESARDM